CAYLVASLCKDISSPPADCWQCLRQPERAIPCRSNPYMNNSMQQLRDCISELLCSPRGTGEPRYRCDLFQAGEQICLQRNTFRSLTRAMLCKLRDAADPLSAAGQQSFAMPRPS